MLYHAYGSYSGYLFGLSPDKRATVEVIVQCTIDELEKPCPHKEYLVYCLPCMAEKRKEIEYDRQ